MNKTLFLLSVGRVLQIIILFLVSRVMTKLLSHEEVGFLYLLLSISSYVGLVVMNPVGVYYTRKLHSWSEEKISVSIFLLVVLFIFLSSLLCFPIVFIGKFFIGLNGYTWISIAMLMTFYVFSSTVNNTLIPSLNILKYRTSFVVLTFLTQFFGLVFSYFLVINNANAFYWLLGQGISFLLFFFITLFYFIYKQDEKIDLNYVTKIKDETKRMSLMRFAFPVAITNVSLWILNQSYRPIIERYIGLDFLGLIGLGFGLATSLSVAFEYLLQQFYYPDFYKDINNKSKDVREKVWNDLFNQMFPLIFFVCIFIGMSSPFIIRILADEKFWEAWLFIGFGMFIEFFRMTNNTLSLISQAEMNTKETIIPYITGGIISLFCVFLTVKVGFQSLIPLSIILGNAVVFGLMIYKMRKIYNINFPSKNIISIFLLSIPFVLTIVYRDSFKALPETLFVLVITTSYFLIVAYNIFIKKLQKA